MSEHLLSYNERQNRKLAMAWYERIDETVPSTRPVGETNYDEEFCKFLLADGRCDAAGADVRG